MRQPAGLATRARILAVLPLTTASGTPRPTRTSPAPGGSRQRLDKAPQRCHNMNMNRTSIVAENALLLQVRSLAARLGLSFSETVRRALAEFVSKNAAGSRRPSFMGVGSSGGKLRISERAEDLLFERKDKAGR